MRTIKVLIADPNPMSRQLLVQTLRSMKGFQLCLAAADCTALPELCADHQPELVILDPGTRFSLVQRLKEEFPWMRIVVLTSLADRELPRLLREKGADSLCHRSAEGVSLSTLIEQTMAGRSVYPETLPPVQIGLARGEDFTPRETDVLRWLLDGHSNSVIAGYLGISDHAVHYHVNNMLSKTGYSSRIKLAVMVERCGFVISAEEYRDMK